MGILNVNEDSFFPGSRVGGNKDLLEFASNMLEDGADILDLGAISSRPGADEFTLEIGVTNRDCCVLNQLIELTSNKIELTLEAILIELMGNRYHKPTLICKFKNLQIEVRSSRKTPHISQYSARNRLGESLVKQHKKFIAWSFRLEQQMRKRHSEVLMFFHLKQIVKSRTTPR